MKLFHSIAIIFVTTAATLDIGGRITRGHTASEGQFPYQVDLLLDADGSISSCSGSLIGKKWILTAAHCLMGIKNVTVFLGSTICQQAEHKREAAKENFIVHHGFNKDIFGRDDIALIKIPSVTLSANIQTIKLPPIFNKTYSNYLNTFAIASGWGQISDKSSHRAHHLQWAQFQIIPNDICAKELEFVMPYSSLCAATPDGVSPCQGDSGDPLVSEEDGTLIGVFSILSEKGCELEYPVEFVRVTDYLGWIYSHTGIFYTNVSKLK